MNSEKKIVRPQVTDPQAQKARMQHISAYEKADCPMLDQDLTLPVNVICDAFVENYETAAACYMDKRMDVVGVVNRVGPDIHAKPSLELSDTEHGRCCALIVFPDDAIYRQVSVGDTVICRGNLLGAMEPWGGVFKKSEIIHVTPKEQKKLRGKAPSSPEEFQERMKRIAYFEQNDCDALQQKEPLDPAAVYNAFIDDYDHAKTVYLEKRAELKGIVNRIGPDIHNKPSIELTDQIGNRCYALFVFADDSFARSVSEGDEVVLRGNLLNAREPFGLTVKKCEIVHVIGGNK